MAYLRRNSQEQLELIAACRASGMTIAAWCLQEGINVDTYYTWVYRLRRRGMLETAATIPETIVRKTPAPEIVKVEVSPTAGKMPMEIGDGITFPGCCPDSSQHDLGVAPAKGAVMEVALGQIRIKVTNQVNPQLLAQTLHLLGGGLGC